MGFLNQSLTQIRDLFASLTPAARITSALLLGVIGVSLAYLFQGVASGSKEPLFYDDRLSTQDVNRMEAAVAALGDYERRGNQLYVPRGRRPLYMAAIFDAGAQPANLRTLLLDQTAGMSVFTDKKMRDDRMKAARELELSMIIREMDGVEDAKVVFDVRESKGLLRDERISATVSIRPAAGTEFDDRRKKLIQRAVCGFIAGLKPADVAILNLRDNSLFEDSATVAADAFEERYLQEKTKYEQMLKAKIEALFKDIPGLSVQISAELDDTLAAQSRVVKSEGEPAAIREETDTTQETTSQTEDQGRVGLSAQGPSRTPADQAVAKNEQMREQNVRDAEYLVPTSEDVRTMSGLVPKRATAAIAIPSEYLVRVYRERTPDAPPDEPPSTQSLQQIFGELEDSIKRMVSPLLPHLPTDDAPASVQVTTVQSLAPPPEEPPSFASRALLFATANSGSLIMAGLAVVSLTMLRSMVKSIPAPETNVILNAPAADGELADSGDAEDRGEPPSDIGEASGASKGRPARPGEKSRPRLRLKKGPSLKDDLTDLVRDDPEAAAAILRTWITNGAA